MVDDINLENGFNKKDSCVQMCQITDTSTDNKTDYAIVLRIDETNHSAFVIQKIRVTELKQKGKTIQSIIKHIGQSIFISKQKMPHKEWKVISLFLPNRGTRKIINGFSIQCKILEMNDNLAKSEMKIVNFILAKGW